MGRLARDDREAAVSEMLMSWNQNGEANNKDLIQQHINHLSVKIKRTEETKTHKFTKIKQFKLG